ncbi:hypothetical protein SAMN05421508_10257 [Caenispirillum bisanense]|uniref:Uncharacterized protein n=1 Tax=Caenispirillum bisanense TaxID=414052 RepID=A0A286G873_9PROT|nr:hypothetical protein SAMN05421508_10257 [Caenispirillum bisanense]
MPAARAGAFLRRSAWRGGSFSCSSASSTAGFSGARASAASTTCWMTVCAASLPRSATRSLKSVRPLAFSASVSGGRPPARRRRSPGRCRCWACSWLPGGGRRRRRMRAAACSPRRSLPRAGLLDGEDLLGMVLAAPHLHQNTAARRRAIAAGFVHSGLVPSSALMVPCTGSADRAVRDAAIGRPLQAGHTNSKTDPPPPDARHVALPPCARATAFTTARPKPLPRPDRSS